MIANGQSKHNVCKFFASFLPIFSDTPFQLTPLPVISRVEIIFPTECGDGWSGYRVSVKCVLTANRWY